MFSYLIKLLMGNSDNLFTGLVVVIFGYYGWLLISINNSLKKILQISEKQKNDLKEVDLQVKKLDEELSRDLADKTKDSLVKLDKMDLKLDKNSKELDRIYTDIVKQVKESSNVVKEVMKITMNKGN